MEEAMLSDTEREAIRRIKRIRKRAELLKEARGGGSVLTFRVTGWVSLVLLFVLAIALSSHPLKPQMASLLPVVLVLLLSVEHKVLQTRFDALLDFLENQGALEEEEHRASQSGAQQKG